MLTLKDIRKDYVAGDMTVHALRGVSISFRESEFVSILGPSGCGKTTLLNIIGGLDQYTDGDLVINGRSTKEYKDRDWDTYRNHTIGFVFQTYNLIPHQSVLANVELALTISGVDREERRERAIKVLERVGLGDQINKKPNQMSGGQMQRVAIARALINDPDILLADEPTGALDSETSVQIMELLKEIASDKLVVMVTHNPDLAERYSTRIVKLLDGQIMGDSDPFNPQGVEPPREDEGKKKPSMSFATALSLSFNNLKTKKARTLLTAFAGSIGIIGIALILSLSNGIQSYINQVQEDTLSTYPLTIEAEAADLSSMIEAMAGAASDTEEHELDAVYSNVILYDLMDSLMNMDTKTNDLESFKDFLDSNGGDINTYTSAIQYVYDSNFDIYTRDTDGNVVKSDVVSLLNELMASMYGGDFSSYFSTMGDFYSNFETWEEMLPGENGELINPTLTNQYDVIYGSWPQNANEVVLIVDQNNEVSDLVLYTLGLRTEDELTSSLDAYMNGETVDAEVESWSYEDLCGRSFKLIGYYDKYVYDAETGTYTDVSGTNAGLDYLYESEDAGITLTISGIVRQSSDAVAGMMTGAIGYTSALTDQVIEDAADSDIIVDQMANPDYDVLTGLPFATGDEPEPSIDEIKSEVDEYIAELNEADAASLFVSVMSTPEDSYLDAAAETAVAGLTREDIETMMMDSYSEEMGVDAESVRDYIAGMDDETLMDYVGEMVRQAVSEQYTEAVEQELSSLSQQQQAMALEYTELSDWQYEYIYNELMPARYAEGSYEDNLEAFGYIDLESPDAINLYAVSFADKDEIARIIDEYNASADEEQQISYTDYVAILMSSISTIINAISYVLIAFVAISLVVSSIMIGIITYISVLERTKEIGILRAIGASKRDVSNVFNAETLIEGLAAGLIGIGMTLILNIPINMIVQHLTGIENLRSVLPIFGGIALVVISMLLTFIAGLIPSGFAARRDPVEALRTE
ncbi:MAG TPA: ABC transporter ATP-binding protein/permease [Candidatus Scatomorpha merdigallinarum]|nr:ABC transporter ATP-binding protein/permease [Candidatus Scatomorpha merdigallinarum]